MSSNGSASALAEHTTPSLGKSSSHDDIEQLICNNLGLVHSCAHKYKGRGIEYEDLYGAGCIGLVKAAGNFDFERGLQFSTYAVPVILGEIRRLFRDGGSVKVSRTLKEMSIKLTKAKQKLSNKLNREPLISELVEETGFEPLRIVEALNSMQPLLSLTADDDDGGGQNDVAVSSCEESVSDKLALREVIELLNEQDRKLITLRYFEGKTQTQTAQIMGLTQVKVSRREKSILYRLRCELLQ